MKKAKKKAKMTYGRPIHLSPTMKFRLLNSAQEIKLQGVPFSAALAASMPTDIIEREYIKTQIEYIPLTFEEVKSLHAAQAPHSTAN